MATALKLDLVPETGTDIVVAVTENPGIVLLDHEKYSVWYEARLAEGKALPSDVTVKKNRDALRTFASDVRSEKADIKRARLRLTEESRTMVNNINAAGKVIDEQLESLAVDIRKPLTDWEDAEKARVDECLKIIDGFKYDAMVSLEDTADDIAARGSAVWAINLDADQFGDMLPEAQAAKDSAVETLKAALVRLKKEEADRAELEKLRAAQAEREAADAAKAEAEEAERYRVETERLAEDRRIAAERDEADRIAAVEKAAADRAREAAEESANAERDRVQREHDAAIAAERAKAAEAERLAQVERDRVAQIEAEREATKAAADAAAKKAADEQAEREKNKAHVSSVLRKAKEAIMGCGVDEATAKAIVVAIKGGMIPAVSLEF